MSPVAMILAAGFGTRLRPLTEELPKPLVPVGDRTVIGHVCDTLRRAGVRRAVVNVHHLADRYDEDVLAAMGLEVTLVREAEILGTAGGVAGARESLGEGDVVVHNGDILAELDLGELLAHHARQGGLATLAVGRLLPAGQGTLGLDAEGAVVRLRGHRFGEEASGAEFSGVQVIAPEGRRRLPERGCLVGDVYLPALERGVAVHAASVVTAFSDVGTLPDYGQANLDWLRRRGQRSWVAASATVSEQVDLEESLVGAGARVTGQGTLERCVVWPGATVEAPARERVFTATGRQVPWRDEAADSMTPVTPRAAARR